MSEKGLFPYPLDQIVYGLLVLGNIAGIFLHPEMATVCVVGALYFSVLLLRPVFAKRRNQVAEASPKKKPDEETKI